MRPVWHDGQNTNKEKVGSRVFGAQRIQQTGSPDNIKATDAALISLSAKNKSNKYNIPRLTLSITLSNHLLHVKLEYNKQK